MKQKACSVTFLNAVSHSVKLPGIKSDFLQEGIQIFRSIFSPVINLAFHQ
jgi:hypothetical protein